MTAVSGEQERLGSWYIPYGDTSSQYLHCDNLQDSVTHTAHSSKRYVISLQWKPPDYFSGNVTILATLVMDYQTYWTNVTSNVIRVRSDHYRDLSEIVDIKVYEGQYDFEDYEDYEYFQEDNSLMESVVSTQMLVDFQKRSTEGEEEPPPPPSTSKEDPPEARSQTSRKSVLLWPSRKKTSTLRTTRRPRTSPWPVTQSTQTQFEAWWRLPVTISHTERSDRFNRPTFFADRAGKVKSTTFRSVLMQPRRDSQSTKTEDSVIPSIEPQKSVPADDHKQVNIPIIISHEQEDSRTTEDIYYQNVLPFFTNIDQNSLETNTVQSVTESFSNLNRLIVTPKNQNDYKKSTYKTSNIQEIDAVLKERDKPYTKMNAEHGSWDNSNGRTVRPISLTSLLLFLIVILF